MISPSWLKSKGYIHLVPQVKVFENAPELISKISNPEYISRYAFFPLIHSTIKERKCKRIPNSPKRKHSYLNEKGVYERTIKNRPLHYGCQMDALIFGYYAEIIQGEYEKFLQNIPGLMEAIIAYRKIPLSCSTKNKSTIHFANELFEEIKLRGLDNKKVSVLTFDIKKFFPSINHLLLKEAWKQLFNYEKLPPDHFNVFKAATEFSYIMLNDFKKSKFKGYDEKHLAQIRNKFGVEAFFESPASFRQAIKESKVKICKYPFRDQFGKPTGIPQGLPISSTLANLYLLKFDIKVLDFAVNQLGAYYRRYSDDIVIVCTPDQSNKIKFFIEGSIEELKVSISKEKTEELIFESKNFRNKPARLYCFKFEKTGELKQSPLIYLGFEFNGKNKLIKSANLARFYRRMIYAIKRKSKRALKDANKNLLKPVIYRRQLYKLNSLPLKTTKTHFRIKTLVPNDKGNFTLISKRKTKLMRSNYLTYIDRASEIMAEPAINNQLRNHRKIFNQAVIKHFRKKR